MDESEIKFQYTGDSDSKDDELEILKAQEKILKLDFKKVKAFAKNSNFVVGHRIYKALKLSGYNWVGMKDELKKYIAEHTICKKIKWKRPANWEDMVEHYLYIVLHRYRN